MSDHPRHKQFIYNDCLIATATIQHIDVTTRTQVDGTSACYMIRSRWMDCWKAWEDY